MPSKYQRSAKTVGSYFSFLLILCLSLISYNAQANPVKTGFPFDAYSTVQFCTDIPEQEQYLKHYLTQLYSDRTFRFLGSDVTSDSDEITYLLVLQGRYYVPEIVARCPFLPNVVVSFLEGTAREEYLKLRDVWNNTLRQFNKLRREKFKKSDEQYSGDYAFIETCMSVNSGKIKGRKAKSKVDFAVVIFDRNYKCPQNFGNLTILRRMNSEMHKKLGTRTKVIFGDDQNGFY